MTDSDKSTQLCFPEDLHYDCLMEGSCCRDAWEIRVDPEAVRRIEASDWRACSSLPGDSDSPFMASKAGEGFLNFRRVGDACSFLSEGNLCRLHEAHGFDFKPRICRTYPFRLVHAPDGIYVGFSFGCDSVLRDTGHPAESYRESIAWMIDDKALHEEIETPIRLDARTELAWEDYRVIEEALTEIIVRRDRPMSQGLVAGHAWLSMLRQMIAVAKVQGGPPPGETIKFYVERTRGDGFARAFDIAGRPVARPTVKRMLLGTFLSFRNSLRPSRQTRVGAAIRVAFQNMRHWMRLGSLPLEPLAKSVPYKQFDPQPGELEDDEIQQLLRRYYRHALFRKDLIRHTDLFWGYCYLLLCHGLIQWYAAGLRASGEPNPTEALRLIEKYFVHHSSFNQVFLYHPAMADIFNVFFSRPHFAHTLVYG